MNRRRYFHTSVTLLAFELAPACGTPNMTSIFGQAFVALPVVVKLYIRREPFDSAHETRLVKPPAVNPPACGERLGSEYFGNFG
jgi:hypothetical protein